jgi:hypothetical protein
MSVFEHKTPVAPVYMGNSRRVPTSPAELTELTEEDAALILGVMKYGKRPSEPALSALAYPWERVVSPLGLKK